MTNQSELEDILDEFVLFTDSTPFSNEPTELRVYLEQCGFVGVMSRLAKEIGAYITANYTPINQPSTKITPVTDGVGGSESTNQSEHKEVK